MRTPETARPARYREYMRYFNTSGPCVPGLHYMLPPEPRLPDARTLIEQSSYFIVHAPRQTGKTTTLAALAQDVTAEGRHVALRFSCERAKVTHDDYGAAETLVLTAIAEEARGQCLGAELMPPSPWPDAPAGSRLRAGLTAWAERCPLPLVLFFDEIDALRGDSLISVLSQLRDGFSSRPRSFPASVVLCGLRDVRDYRVASGADPARLGTSSPFNVSVRSMRMGDFTRNQVAELYGQHTAETGQEFTAESVDRAFEYSQGQPWLVNAIAYEITGTMGIKPPEPITVAHVDQAKERLILARATHMDYLATRLAEPRVKGVIEPLLAGDFPVDADPVYDDDVSYVRDLGLIARNDPVRVANPIYKEVIVRVLGRGVQRVVTAEPRSFLLPDGRLDFGRVLTEFAAFWRENGEILVKSQEYHEVAPQLVFMAYLQRIVNGGGYVDREYGIGRGRIDVLVRKPYTDLDGKPAVQREAIELKVRRQGRGNPLKEGLTQLDGYLARLGLDTGTLIIFDRRPAALRKHPNPQFSRPSTPEGREVTLLSA
ncbi:MAG: AAA family ATPase [Trebonia sp.]